MKQLTYSGYRAKRTSHNTEVYRFIEESEVGNALRVMARGLYMFSLKKSGGRLKVVYNHHKEYQCSLIINILRALWINL